MDESWAPLVKDDVFFNEAASPGVTYVFESAEPHNGLQDPFYNYADYGSDGISPCSSTSYLPSPEATDLSPSQLTQAIVNGFVDLDTPPTRFLDPAAKPDASVCYPNGNNNNGSEAELSSAQVKQERFEADDRPGSPLSSASSDVRSFPYLHSPGMESAFGDYKQHAAPGPMCYDLDLAGSDLLPPVPPSRTRSKMHDLAVRHRLITDQNTRGNGSLYLSPEEKRTLLQEGYDLPTKLPLTREQEEALKIVRRKIKNKLSAQESRRKRKEYIDTLEKKIHSYYNDNLSLRNKLKHYETVNRDLQTRLKRFECQSKS